MVVHVNVDDNNNKNNNNDNDNGAKKWLMIVFIIVILLHTPLSVHSFSGVLLVQTVVIHVNIHNKNGSVE